MFLTVTEMSFQIKYQSKWLIFTSLAKNVNNRVWFGNGHVLMGGSKCRKMKTPENEKIHTFSIKSSECV